MSNRIFALSVALLLGACGTYRSAIKGYQSSVGGWRTPSDYSPTADGGYAVSEKVAPGANYVPSGDFKLYWPVKNVRVNRGYRPRNDRDHQGVDLGGKKGTPILAAHEGVVVYTGRDFRGYGNMVLIEYDKQWATLYGHLNEIVVDEGRIVKPGDPIGAMGRTGHATGVHLHFELIKDKMPVDPLPFLTRNSHMAQR
jgi:murein DD-endopeptidase MepM/ murein hydrolase activator NlpD